MCFWSVLCVQDGDLPTSTTTCGSLCWAHCSAVWSCLLSTGGRLCSHTPSNSFFMFTSLSRSQVSYMLMFSHLEVQWWCFQPDFHLVVSSCELGFLQAGGNLRERSKQRSGSDGHRGSRQELQVNVYRAFAAGTIPNEFVEILLTNATIWFWAVLSFVRPQILAMTGSVRDRPALLDLANCFTKNYGLCLSCEVFVVRLTQRFNPPQPFNPPKSHFKCLHFSQVWSTHAWHLYGSKANMLTSVTLWFLCSQGPRSEALEEINACMEKNQLWLTKTKRKAFYTPVACEDFRAGAESLLQVSREGSILKKTAGFKLLFYLYVFYKILCSYELF